MDRAKNPLLRFHLVKRVYDSLKGGFDCVFTADRYFGTIEDSVANRRPCLNEDSAGVEEIHRTLRGVLRIDLNLNDSAARLRKVVEANISVLIQ